MLCYLNSDEDATINPMVAGYQDDLDPEDVPEGGTLIEDTQEKLTISDSNGIEFESTTSTIISAVPVNFLSNSDLSALENLYKPSNGTIASISAPSCSSYSADADMSELGSEAGSVRTKKVKIVKVKTKDKEKPKEKVKKKTGKKKKSRKDENEEEDESQRLEDFLGPSDVNLKISRHTDEYDEL